MSRVVHFEFPADNPDRAADFYGKVFGWSFTKWSGPMEYWLITTGPDATPGINGGMMRRSPETTGTVNTVSIADIDASLASVEKNGGKQVAPKMHIPGVGWVAYCIDTEGNQFGLIQMDTPA
jgi:predicted enzyme related to lactoylglutathione lyase